MATTVDSFQTGSSVLSIVRVLNFSLPSLPCFTVTNGSLLPEKRVEIELHNLLAFFFFWLSPYKQLWDQISPPPSSMDSSGTTSHPFPLNKLLSVLGSHLTFLVHFSQLPPIYVLSSVYNNAERFRQKGASSIFHFRLKTNCWVIPGAHFISSLCLLTESHLNFFVQCSELSLRDCPNWNELKCPVICSLFSYRLHLLPPNRAPGKC